MTLLTTLIGTLLFAVAGPIVGCLLAGLDRIISARMQGRVGPPLLQPYYDVRKLFEKERVSVNSVEGVYVACALLFALIAGGIFYSGGNLLLCVFVITLSSLFFIMAAYSTRSPYAEIGAARETLQVMSYEPMVLLMAVAFFQASGSFDVAEVLQLDHPIICTIWLVFLGVLFILTIKLRKSPSELLPDDGIETLAQFVQTAGSDTEPCGLPVPAKAEQHVGAAREARVEVEFRNGAA